MICPMQTRQFTRGSANKCTLRCYFQFSSSLLSAKVLIDFLFPKSISHSGLDSWQSALSVHQWNLLRQNRCGKPAYLLAKRGGKKSEAFQIIFLDVGSSKKEVFEPLKILKLYNNVKNHLINVRELFKLHSEQFRSSSQWVRLLVRKYCPSEHILCSSTVICL